MLLFLSCLLYLLSSYIICPSLRAGLSVCIIACLFHAVSMLSFFTSFFFWRKADMRRPARAVLFMPTILYFLAVVHTIECHAKHWAKRTLQSFWEIQLFHVYVYKSHTRNRTQQHWLCTEGEHLLHSSSTDTGDTRLPFSAFIPSREKVKQLTCL